MKAEVKRVSRNPVTTATLSCIQFSENGDNLTRNFSFLRGKWDVLANLGEMADKNVYHDPHTTLMKLWLFGEKEVTLLKTGRHNNQGTVWLEKDVRKALIKEATAIGLDVADYIRGILYSLNQKFAQEEIAEREHQDKIRHDKRKIPVSLTLDKDLREKLYKRFEKELQNEELKEKVKRKPKPMNGPTVEDRMLQEVLNNHLLEYLNK